MAVTISIEYTDEQWSLIQEFFPIREDTPQGFGLPIPIEEYTPTKLGEVLRSHVSQMVKRNRLEKIERELEAL